MSATETSAAAGKPPGRARTATLKRLRVHTLPLWLDPVPVDKTLRSWFARAGVRRWPANKSQIGGGAEVYYSVADVEKFLAGRLGC